MTCSGNLSLKLKIDDKLNALERCAIKSRWRRTLHFLPILQVRWHKNTLPQLEEKVEPESSPLIWREKTSWQRRKVYFLGKKSKSVKPQLRTSHHPLPWSREKCGPIILIEPQSYEPQDTHPHVQSHLRILNFPTCKVELIQLRQREIISIFGTRLVGKINLFSGY